jgi:hypothetical protein
MKKVIIRWLLAVLNSSWLNKTPCKYEYVGNVNAFSLDNLESEERQRPGITVKQILEEAARFRACPLKAKGVTVIEGSGYRDADAWDLHELRHLADRGHE